MQKWGWNIKFREFQGNVVELLKIGESIPYD